MDDADRADEHILNTILDGIDRAHRAMDLRATGFCYNCNTVVPYARIFCSAECRDDWDWIQARRRMNREV